MKIRIPFWLPLLFLLSCEPENSAPNALFTCVPPEGNINTLFDLDATASVDPDGLKYLLQFRWDYNGDGTWDTPFGNWEIFSCRFPVPGSYTIRLEVKDNLDAVTSASITVHVDSLHRITDPRDGQVYPVVKIGSWWWLGRNLNCGKELNPNIIPINNNVIEKYTYPTEDPDSLNGGLYTWLELMAYGYVEGGQGICPPGWHVPTDAEWNDLLSVFRNERVPVTPAYYISGSKFIPDQTVVHYNYRSIGAIWKLLRETGSTGFDAVPLGYLDPDGVFSDRDYHFPGRTSTFWTSTMSGDYAYRVRMYQTEDHQGDVFRFADNRRYAFSVRCVKGSL
jgi:uncharacterized protein (TIGR02145 family)